jgi:hypothetical protein
MTQRCQNCLKWETDWLTYPYGKCLDKNTFYSERGRNSYYLEGSGCDYYQPAPPREETTT